VNLVVKKIKILTFSFFQQNINMSLAGFALTYGITKHLSFQYPIKYASITALLSFVLYSLHRIIDNGKLNFRKNTNPIIISSIALILCSYLVIETVNLTYKIVLFSAFFVFLSIWYLFPLFARKKIREISGLKIIVISITWTYASAGFPVLNENAITLINFQFLVLLMFYFVAVTLPFDIRDKYIDEAKQYTIPQLIGTRATKLLGIFLLLGVYFCHIMLKICDLNNFVLQLAIGVQIVLLLTSNEQKKATHFIFIDLSIILLGIAYLL